MVIHDSWCENPGKVIQAIKDYFDNRLCATESSIIKLDNINFPTIIDLDNSMLVSFVDEV